MARITVEDCLKKVNSRFELVHLAIKRVKDLKKGISPLVECDNKEVVTALREIAAGRVYPIKRVEYELSEIQRKAIPEAEPESEKEVSEKSEKLESEEKNE